MARPVIRATRFLFATCLATCGVVLVPAHASGQAWYLCQDASYPGTPSPTFHGRLADPRINYGVLGPYVCRWDLERRDPKATSSDVVRPITYVLDTTTILAEWLPYFKRSVEAWLPVFDAIGLHHAVTTRFAGPNDSIWSANFVVNVQITPEDAGGATTNCLATAVSGEMIRCTISIHRGTFGPDVQNYCMQTAGADPAVPWPCPDSIMGFALQGTVTHEIGHSLGLAHNFGAGTAYPTDSLRSASFVRRWGFAPSIMTHDAYDRMAQPEDHIPQRDLWLKIGPYDYWAIAWAYRPIPRATTPEAEQPTLEHWRRAQDTAAYLRDVVGGSHDNDDSRQQWGGQDIVEATSLLRRNMARFWARIHTNDSDRATFMASYSMVQLNPLEQILIADWQSRLRLVTNLLGGSIPQPPFPRALDSVRMVSVSTARQLRAMRFVLASALYGQDPLITTWQHWQSKTSSEASSKAAHADSIPVLFDTTSGDQTAVAMYWVDAQQKVLSYMMTRVPQMPAGARPVACRYLTDALRALTMRESQIRPAQAAQAVSLRAMLSALDSSVCRQH